MTTCRRGCGRPVMEDETCEDCLVEDIVEYAMKYDREEDDDAPDLILVELGKMH